MKKKGLTIMLTLTMILFMFSATAYSSEFVDMPDDWSTQALEKAVKNGLLKGDNGKIMPNEKLTRAQIATIVNRAFGAVAKSDINNFTDVAKDAWYYDEMAKAVYMQTFAASGSNLYPNNSITREETFVVLARAFKTSGSSEEVLAKFKDSSSLSEWAKDGVASLIEAGYIEGYNGLLSPKQNITRAEFAQIMDNLLKNYIKEKGIYSTSYDGSVMINVSGVIIKDLTINGDLIIGDGVGEGEVILDNVVITGRTLIRGAKSVRIIGNSKLSSIIMEGSDIVLVVELGSSIETVEANKKGIIIKGDGNVKEVLANSNNIAVTTPNTIVKAALGTIGITAGGEEVEGGTSITTPSAITSSPGSSGGKTTTAKAVLVSKEQGGGMPTVEVKLKVKSNYIDNFVLLFDENKLAESENGTIVVPAAVLHDLNRVKVKYNNTIKEVDANTVVTNW